MTVQGEHSALERDLSLVLPELRRAQATSLDPRAVEQARALIHAAQAPAIVGLAWFSMEAARHAIALAEKIRGRLLPQPLPIVHPLIQTATLGHLLHCDLVIWVGPMPLDHPVVRRIRQRVAQHLPMDAGLEVVTALRHDPQAIENHKARRIGVVLAPDADPRLCSQWHKLAAQLQRRRRMTVITLPDLQAANIRGVLETITWQTGLSGASGGVDFADGSPRPCGPYRDNSTDLLIDCRAADRIVIGEVSFDLPGLALGLAARVMRFDGVILWLCDDPDNARADPAAELLARLGEGL